MPKLNPIAKKDDKNQQQEAKLWEEKYKRALADYHNLQKRVESQQSQFLRLANIPLLERFLTILDHLETASKHIDDPGLAMVISEFHRNLTEEGVQEVEVKDSRFNPQEMECVETVPGEKDHVVRVISKGYKLNDHLIRPAKVEVGDGTTTSN